MLKLPWKYKYLPLEASCCTIILYFIQIKKHNKSCSKAYHYVLLISVVRFIYSHVEYDVRLNYGGVSIAGLAGGNVVLQRVTFSLIDLTTA